MAIDSVGSTSPSSFDPSTQTDAASGSSAPPSPKSLPPASGGASTVTSWSPPAGGAAQSFTEADVERLLSRRLLDPFITNADVSQAMSELKTLRPAQFRDAVDELGRHGKLEKLLDKEGGQRAAFLSLCAEKGLVERVPGKPAQGALSPPSSPDLYQQSVLFPTELNDAIHAETMAAAGRYASEYKSYQGRYAAAVERCTSGAELRALGPHAPAQSFHELTDPKDPSTRRYEREWRGHAMPTEAPALRAVNAKLAELNRAHADDWVEAKVKVATESSVHTLKLDTGNADQKLHLASGLKLEAGHGAELEVMGDGEQELKLQRQGLGSVTAIAKDGHLESLGAELHGYGAALEGEKMTFQMPVVPGLVAKSWADNETGGVGASLTYSGEVPGLGKVSATVGFGSRGLSRAEAREVTSGHEGAFDRPAELAARTPWSELSPEVRARHQENGWTEREWTRALR